MKQLVIGILAHVDAGKTTLSEALLYTAGAIPALGRVDHRDAYLDTHALERDRGITIFSKQALFQTPALAVTLLDTPGHVDFSAEMERTLQVLDYAILVISATDGVQAHTETLWRLLRRNQIPTFLFVTKMDLPNPGREAILAGLQRQLDEGCADFTRRDGAWAEGVALRDEGLLDRYLETGRLTPRDVSGLVRLGRLFPCYFGAALRLEGVADFLQGLTDYTEAPVYPPDFAARVFKIARDSQGNRLTYAKLTGGTLAVRAPLSYLPQTGGEVLEEKVTQLRLYSGAKYQTAEAVSAGQVCALLGLTQTYPGQGLGAEPPAPPPLLEPVVTYRLVLPPDCPAQVLLPKLRQLEEEDPQLHLVWDEHSQEIHARLMGQVQIEVLQRLIADRFDVAVQVDAGRILYKETIAAPVEGVGHFEPLRHYAEVHLLLEPLPQGSGLVFDSRCSEDLLDRNWQRLILTHLAERTHRGVLTGAPITDLRITLLSGRAHPKHTEGGDFRQATYRAVRQGLMEAESILLEPWYDFRLELPAPQVGRAMTDLQQMGAQLSPPETAGEEAVLTGAVAVSALGDYAREVAAYTQGRGRLLCSLRGYAPCADQDAVLASVDYDPTADLDNSPDSVFCSHGAGVIVPWDEVPARAHVSSGLDLGPEKEEPAGRSDTRRASVYAGTIEQDKELQAIFERTYGPVKRRAFIPPKDPRRPAPTAEAEQEKRTIREQFSGPEYLLVDGYNIIFAWDELKAIARDNLDAARKQLCDLLSNYRGFRKCEVIAVFDAYKVKGGQGSVEKYHDIHVVYTKEAETADTYIERATYEIGRRHRVRVATSDGPEQLIILGHGALRLSASAFRQEVEQVEGQIADILAANNRRQKTGNVRSALERAQRQTEEEKP